MPLKYFLPLYLLAFFCAAFFWLVHGLERTGVNPVVFKDRMTHMTLLDEGYRAMRDPHSIPIPQVKANVPVFFGVNSLRTGSSNGKARLIL